MSSNPRHQQIAQECDRIKEILIAKNAAYGDSAIKPLRIFSKASPIEAINVRLDDKLSRIVRGDGTGDEDAELDLIGYLILKRVTRLEGKPEHVLDMAPGEGIEVIRKLPTLEEAEKAMEADYMRLSQEAMRRVLERSGIPVMSSSDHSYQNDTKSKLDEVARKVNEAVNPPDQIPTSSTGFQKELEGLINCYSMENGSDTPDFLLAEFLCDVLEVWNKGVVARKWYGRVTEPVPAEEAPVPSFPGFRVSTSTAEKRDDVSCLPNGDGTLTGESLDAIEAEMKKSAAPIAMVDGKPQYVMHVEAEEVPDEWDERRSWKPGSVIRWRGRMWIMRSKLKQSYTLSPGRSVCWKPFLSAAK